MRLDFLRRTSVMSASHRSLSRLPLSVFSGLLINYDTIDDPSLLRKDICFKLREIQHGGATGTNSAAEGVTTVGQLLKLSSSALLRALDPILTNGKITYFAA